MEELWGRRCAIKILALDLATKTGWAYGETEDSHVCVHSGVQDFSLKRGESGGMRLLHFDRWIYQMLAETDPKVVVYETPHHQGGHATEVLLGLVGILQKAACEAKVEYSSVHSATLKKFATGSGRASKEEMKIRAIQRFARQVVDDNEADALHIWDWARENIARRK